MRGGYIVGAIAAVAVVAGLIFMSIDDKDRPMQSGTTSQSDPGRADPSAGSNSTR